MNKSFVMYDYLKNVRCTSKENSQKAKIMVPGEMPESRRENTANLKLRGDLWGEALANFIQIKK